MDDLQKGIAAGIASEYFNATRVSHQEHMAAQVLHVTLNPEVVKALGAASDADPDAPYKREIWEVKT